VGVCVEARTRVRGREGGAIIPAETVLMLRDPGPDVWSSRWSTALALLPSCIDASDAWIGLRVPPPCERPSSSVSHPDLYKPTNVSRTCGLATRCNVLPYLSLLLGALHALAGHPPRAADAQVTRSDVLRLEAYD
jgi:hypothetical protein